MDVSARRIVISFPHDDLAFGAHIQAAADALDPRAGPGAIESEIRKAYPAAVVRRAHQMATVNGQDTWYAYREGSITLGADDGEWWLDDRHPHAVISTAGDYVDANPGVVELFGVPKAQIVGSPAGSFTRHEGGDEVGRRLFAVLAETGALHSTAVVVRPDGAEWPIEFHMYRAHGQGSYHVVMRRI